jgi:hypothetical protein
MRGFQDIEALTTGHRKLPRAESVSPGGLGGTF